METSLMLLWSQTESKILDNKFTDAEIPTEKNFLGYSCWCLVYTTEVCQKLAMLLGTEIKTTYFAFHFPAETKRMH